MLHYADLPTNDIRGGAGYKFTRPVRTILDLIEAGKVELTFIRQALRQAVNRDLITRRQLRDALISDAARKIAVDALRRAA